MKKKKFQKNLIPVLIGVSLIVIALLSTNLTTPKSSDAETRLPAQTMNGAAGE